MEYFTKWEGNRCKYLHMHCKELLLTPATRMLVAVQFQNYISILGVPLLDRNNALVSRKKKGKEKKNLTLRGQFLPDWKLN